MHDVSGVSGAAPVWREVMDWLHRGDPNHGRPPVASRPPAPPAGVVARGIRFEPPREPPRKEWFLAGTEMTVVKAAAGRALARIAYPTEGTVVALDPDIPPARQRLPLALSAPAGAGWQWRLDGQALGRAADRVLWLPQPGRHRLVLADGRGREIDAVAFQVRAMKATAGH
jgi:penicillin-binding protein 1C